MRCLISSSHLSIEVKDMAEKITMTYIYNCAKAVDGDMTKGVKASLSTELKTTDVDVYAFDAVGNTALCWLKAPGISAVSQILSVDANEKVLSVETAALSGWMNVSVCSLQPK